MAGRLNFSGSMADQSQTLPGKKSTLMDRVKSRMVDLGDAGFTGIFNDLIDKSSELMLKLEPIIKEYGPKLVGVMRSTVGVLKTLSPLLKPIAMGVGLIAFRWASLKLIVAGGWMLKAVRLLGMMRLGAIGTQLAIFAIPIAIGAAIAAVVYLGYQIYRYFP
jgi:hypothetical protein